ncbi:hypothetical protein L0Y40_00530, partial [Candidatus Wolfebacteria bacterium]|nr:hypothetical protein [Candidatus Wolfebacteria bacterium]
AANKNDRKFLGFAPREQGAKGWRWYALRAYDWVSSHHALGAWKGQSLRDWKKVRAKVNISAPNDTSRFESADEPRAAGAAFSFAFASGSIVWCRRQELNL